MFGSLVDKHRLSFHGRDAVVAVRGLQALQQTGSPVQYDRRHRRCGYCHDSCPWKLVVVGYSAMSFDIVLPKQPPEHNACCVFGGQICWEMDKALEPHQHHLYPHFY